MGQEGPADQGLGELKFWYSHKIVNGAGRNEQSPQRVRPMAGLPVRKKSFFVFCPTLGALDSLLGAQRVLSRADEHSPIVAMCSRQLLGARAIDTTTEESSTLSYDHHNSLNPGGLLYIVRWGSSRCSPVRSARPDVNWPSSATEAACIQQSCLRCFCPGVRCHHRADLRLPAPLATYPDRPSV